jgi:ABC-type nitrate/sulfonate/bicarbonate transport system substrate-binding protein
MINRGSFIAILALSGVLVLAAQVHSQDHVRIGISSHGFGFLPTVLAEKNGFYAKYGIATEHVMIKSSIATVALDNNDIDYYMGVGPAISAVLKGVPLKITMLTAARLHFLLLVKPEVQNVADLRGKTIGISRFGSTTHLTLRTILNHFGLVAGKDVKLFAGGDPQSLLAAMQKGQIDAAYHGTPLDIGGTKLGYKILLWARDYLDQPMASLVVTDNRLKQNPDQIKRIMKGTLEGLSFIRSEKKATVQFVSQWMRVDPAIAATMYENLSPIFSKDGTISDKGIESAVEDVLEQSKSKKEVPVSAVVDSSLIEQVQREMGLR